MWAQLVIALVVWKAVAVRAATSSQTLNEDVVQQLESGEQKPPPEVLQRLEGSFLRLFSMKTRPSSEQRVPVPDYLKEVFNQVSGTSEEWGTVDLDLPGKHTDSANTVRSFFHNEEKVSAGKYPANLQRLWFDVSTLPSEETLKATELVLTYDLSQEEDSEVSQEEDSEVSQEADSEVSQRADSEAAREAGSEVVTAGRLAGHTVQVYDIVRRTGADGRPVVRLLDTQTVRVSGRGRVVLEVRPAVQRWLVRPAANHGLLVRVLPPSVHRDSESVRLRRRRDEPAAAWAARQPLLVTYTDDGRPRSRTKRRAAGQHKRRHKARECSRRVLYVDFQEVGWDNWIVAPPGYPAYFCYGECTQFPLPDHLNATNHAIVQNLVNSMKGGSVVPPPCCVPTELSAITMLYMDEIGKVQLKNYENMSVVGCGCR